jgi:16S rRNA G966 N2-methylase RsmD
VWPLSLPRGIARLRDALGGTDLVLLDPPYGRDLARATLEALGARGTVPEGCRVVLEHHRRDAAPEAAGELLRRRQRTYGETVVSTYHVRAEGDVAAARGGDA